MGRRRVNNIGNLPPRMHFKGGAYYYVTSGKPRKWIRLDESLAKARLKWAELENGNYGNTDRFSVRLDQFLVSPAFQELAKNTRAQYTSAAAMLRLVFGDMSMASIKPFHIATWLDDHPHKTAANTGKAVMSRVFDHAVRQGLVDRNPCKEISYNRIPPRDRLISDDEYRRIYEQACDVVQIAMDMAYYSGMRISDVLKVRLQDLGPDGLYSVQKKTGKRQIFAYTQPLREVIDRARSLRCSVKGMHLLCDRSGQPYEYHMFNRRWLKAVRAAGVEDVRFHDIRAKSATDAKGMGLDYQALLGHSSRSMSDRYVRSREYQRVEPISVKLLVNGQ